MDILKGVSIELKVDVKSKEELKKVIENIEELKSVSDLINVTVNMIKL